MRDGTINRRQYAIAVDIGDRVLAADLMAALEEHPRLHPAAFDDMPDVAITDRVDPGASAQGTRVVRFVGHPAATLPADADPHLVLAVAHVIAAGHGVESDGDGTPGSVARRAGDAMAGAVDLSPREREVATLLVDGASNKHIARALDISERTAKFHVAAVIRKLGATNRSDAVAVALRNGLVAL